MISRANHILFTVIRFLCISVFILLVLPTFADSQDEAREYKAWVSGGLPEDCVPEGAWYWDDKVLCAGAMSHMQYAAAGIDKRSFRINGPLAINADSSVVQYVYIDPQGVPDGIMIKLFLASGDAMSFYWEGYEEAFVILDEYINAWYMDFMPEASKWVRVVIDFNELDMSKAGVTGIEYIVSNGRVWWGQTLVSV
jgi:hypothetical protein